MENNLKYHRAWFYKMKNTINIISNQVQVGWSVYILWEETRRLFKFDKSLFTIAWFFILFPNEWWVTRILGIFWFSWFGASMVKYFCGNSRKLYCCHRLYCHISVIHLCCCSHDSPCIYLFYYFISEISCSSPGWTTLDHLLWN